MAKYSARWAQFLSRLVPRALGAQTFSPKGFTRLPQGYAKRFSPKGFIRLAEGFNPVLVFGRLIFDLDESNEPTPQLLSAFV